MVKKSKCNTHHKYTPACSRHILQEETTATHVLSPDQLQIERAICESILQCQKDLIKSNIDTLVQNLPEQFKKSWPDLEHQINYLNSARQMPK